MKIYIVFGDIARSGGENIDGIFFNEKNAEKHKEMLESHNNGTIYHIEECEIYDEVN